MVNTFWLTLISYTKWSINQVSDLLMLYSKLGQVQVTWLNYFWKELKKSSLLKSIQEWWLNSAKDLSTLNMPASSYSFLAILCMLNFLSLIFALQTYHIKSVHHWHSNYFHTNRCSDVQYLCSKNNSLNALLQSLAQNFIVVLVLMSNFFHKSIIWSKSEKTTLSHHQK